MHEVLVMSTLVAGFVVVLVLGLVFRFVIVATIGATIALASGCSCWIVDGWHHSSCAC